MSEFRYERCIAGSAKTLEFVTTATAVSFDYKLVWEGSQDSIELAVNGLLTQVWYVRDLKKEGTISFELPEGEKSAQTYVSVANRLLNYDVLNQGIGGYVYDKNVLMEMEGYQPDKIIVALGTNQFGTESMQDIEEYYERLMEIQKLGF